LGCGCGSGRVSPPRNPRMWGQTRALAVRAAHVVGRPAIKTGLHRVDIGVVRGAERDGEAKGGRVRPHRAVIVA
jgi:hypothetical protein